MKINDIIFDYLELISVNFYKIVFKPITCDEFILNNILNLIRQSLFSNTYGYSVTEISLPGINSEYGYLFGLKEDILNLILNLKGLVFKLKKKKKLILNISTFNKLLIKGSDIKFNKNFKVLNPEHVICHLNENINFNLFMKVEKGKGYIPFNSDIKYRNVKSFKNGILIDSYFCPIIKASYVIKRINNTFCKNFKRIIFFIETNGSVNVKNSLFNAINNIFSILSNFVLSKSKIDDYSGIKTPIFDTGLSFRTIKYLVSYGIFNLNDLFKCTRFNIFTNSSKFTQKTIFEIKNVLKNYGFNFF